MKTGVYENYLMSCLQTFQFLFECNYYTWVEYNVLDCCFNL